MGGQKQGLKNQLCHPYLYLKTYILIADMANIEKEKDENMITCVSVKMSLEKITTANILVKFLEADK